MKRAAEKLRVKKSPQIANAHNQKQENIPYFYNNLKQNIVRSLYLPQDECLYKLYAFKLGIFNFM